MKKRFSYTDLEDTLRDVGSVLNEWEQSQKGQDSPFGKTPVFQDAPIPTAHYGAGQYNPGSRPGLIGSVTGAIKRGIHTGVSHAIDKRTAVKHFTNLFNQFNKYYNMFMGADTITAQTTKSPEQSTRFFNKGVKGTEPAESGAEERLQQLLQRTQALSKGQTNEARGDYIRRVVDPRRKMDLSNKLDYDLRRLGMATLPKGEKPDISPESGKHTLGAFQLMQNIYQWFMQQWLNYLVSYNVDPSHDNPQLQQLFQQVNGRMSDATIKAAKIGYDVGGYRELFSRYGMNKEDVIDLMLELGLLKNPPKKTDAGTEENIKETLDNFFKTSNQEEIEDYISEIFKDLDLRKTADGKLYLVFKLNDNIKVLVEQTSPPSLRDIPAGDIKTAVEYLASLIKRTTSGNYIIKHPSWQEPINIDKFIDKPREQNVNDLFVKIYNDKMDEVIQNLFRTYLSTYIKLKQYDQGTWAAFHDKIPEYPMPIGTEESAVEKLYEAEEQLPLQFKYNPKDITRIIENFIILHDKADKKTLRKLLANIAKKMYVKYDVIKIRLPSGKESNPYIHQETMQEYKRRKREERRARTRSTAGF